MVMEGPPWRLVNRVSMVVVVVVLVVVVVECVGLGGKVVAVVRRD